MGAALFRHAGSKGQVSRRASAFVDDGTSIGDNAVEGTCHSSFVDSSESKVTDQPGSDDFKISKSGKQAFYSHACFDM